MNIKSYLLAAALASTAIGSAQAATVVHTDSHGPAQTAWTTNLSVPQFDASLGTLNSVTVAYTAGIATTGELTNRDATVKTLTVDVTAGVILQMPAGVTGIPTMNENIAETQTYPDVDPQETVVVNITGNGSDTGTTAMASDLAAFTGAGSVSFASSADSSAVATGAANILVDVLTAAEVTVEVTYEYSEPLVSAMQCGATLGAGGDSVTAVVSGDETCDNLSFVETITCNGDLAYTAALATPGCSVVESPDGTFPATCAGLSPVLGTQSFSVISGITGTDGRCTTSVTSMSCVTPSGDTLAAAVDNCGDSHRIAPPTPVPSLPPIAPNVPTLSEWALIMLAGLLALVGFQASRRRS